MITHHDLEDRPQDIKDGCYCPDLSDLIAACGPYFSRLSIPKACGRPRATTRHA